MTLLLRNAPAGCRHPWPVAGSEWGGRAAGRRFHRRGAPRYPPSWVLSRRLAGAQNPPPRQPEARGGHVALAPPHPGPRRLLRRALPLLLALGALALVAPAPPSPAPLLAPS